MRIGEQPPHGTRARYQYRFGNCRCVECTAANTRWVRDWRKRVAVAALAE